MSAFSVRTVPYGGSQLLNICDADLLGRSIKDGKRSMEIGRYYQDRLVDRDEAGRLLQSSHIINMVGQNSVELSLELEIGARSAVKKIGGVPFLLVFTA